MKSIFFLLVFLLTMVVSPAGTMADGVVLGVILPLSGAHAAVGHMQKNSMLMAVEEINTRGGISPEPLALDIRDSGGQARSARAVVDHFVNDKDYPIVLGGFSSSVAAALADKCEQKRIPVVVVTGSEDAITLQNYRYVFRVAPPRSRYPAAVLDFARSRFGRANIVLITERSVYGDAMARTVRQASRDAGWTISGEWKFDSGSRNLEALYSKVPAADPKVIFLSAFPPDGPKIIRELKLISPGSAIFNLTPASTAAGSYAQCGAGCAGVMNPALWLPGAGQSAARYREKYAARYGSEPDYHGAQAYAAVMVADQAIRKAGAARAESVRDALEDIAVNTPYGRVNFRQWDGFVNQNDPPNYVLQWTSRGFEVLWPEQYRTAEPMVPQDQ
jgi:branched-chain amino acid transport system substrate-binding protein